MRLCRRDPSVSVLVSDAENRRSSVVFRGEMMELTSPSSTYDDGTGMILDRDRSETLVKAGSLQLESFHDMFF